MGAGKGTARRQKKKRGFPTRFAALIGGSLLLIAALSLINLSPTLSHLDAELLSGPETGNYHEIAARLEDSARSQDGHLGNHTSKGSVDNLERLVAERDNCSLHFAMVQDGVAPTKKGQLELIRRLGCTHGQGYLFAPPLEAEEALAHLARSRGVDLE